ncbi:membrane-bound PQQ-dependent dehydrogenase, glucose/quinate/shikimate family [Massilia sp. YIM B02763]|uniref:membrane-bound PQQ-dependent dehydrogenase, glucose/quinate/shikimate family n=1 Tax=Massilia sp. YIM B02763 TaxID=3050130 RepID=UPI0025B72169|nr:membrane-bound PQQ-dependent dehydrogenase, glucose/quinate/shikimate family [Massilia sp. YIM B02763]MDN4056531.1 membrane-bound PQQ-dependent dehydrogenase, glucose/quinate/shikimate family [Massilia sp. YIM B02763]
MTLQLDSAADPNVEYKHHTLMSILLGLVILAMGLALFVGGAYLLILGGSFYYIVAGALFSVAGYLTIKRKIVGFYVYSAAFAFTLLWTFWEVGLSGWELAPRLAVPFVLFVLTVLLIPALGAPNGKLQRRLGLYAVAVFVVVLAVLVPAFNRYPAPSQLPAIQAGAIYEDASYAPVKGEWNAYGAGESAQRYSASTQITAANVKDLKRVWTFHTGDIPGKYGSELTPLKIGNALYGCTPMNKIFALDAATGKKLWMYDPQVPQNWIPYTAACRGVTYYKNPKAMAGQACAERIIEGTLDMRLIAVDAKSGQLCKDFGTNGAADLKVGLAQKDSATGAVTPVIPGTAAITAPPVIVRGIVVTGHQVLDGQRRWAASGVIRGYDAISGELRFAWDINQPEVTKLPPIGKPYSFGTPNMWTTAVGDEKLGLVYLPMGNSAADYFSSLRSAEEKKYSSSLVALDVVTGKPRWVYQTVHNDVWDYDLGSQPTLVEFPTANGRLPAIVLPSKTGDVFVLDRLTGKPLHRVDERSVPQGGAEPDQRSKTQPFSLYHTLRKAELREKDMWGISPIDQMICRINFRRARYEGPYTPPEVNRRTIEYPGYNGGSDWGSVAVDPRRGIIIANYNDMPNYNMLINRDKANALDLFPAGDPRAAGSASGAEGAGAQTGTPFGILVNAGWQMPTGVLCKRPPYGGIRAIELATGRTLWDRPYGSARRNGPFGIPSLIPLQIGTPNNGGPVVTAGGLIFIAAATDNLIKAIDIKTGDIVWSDTLPAGGQATPIVYEQNGKQYLVIMAGGHHFMMTPSGDSLIAYALPEKK